MKIDLRHILLVCIASINLVFCALAHSATPLPENEAFKFSYYHDVANQQLITEWRIAPGYYLYKERLHITLTPVSGGKAVVVTLPPAEIKPGSEQHPEQVYTGLLQIPLALSNAAEKWRLQVKYQGCAQQGFCYPPITKEITFIPAQLTVPADKNQTLKTLLTNQNSVSHLLANSRLSTILLLCVGLGLLLSLTPCVWPMVPILGGIIIGQKQPVSLKKSFLLSLTYVLSVALTYAVAGVAAASLGRSIQVLLQKPPVILVSGAVFVLLALSLFDLYHFRLPKRLSRHLHRWHHRQQGGTLLGVMGMGILSTLIVSPCVTAPLIGVLIFISQTGEKLLGGLSLFAIGIGMGIPIMFVGLSAGRWLPRSGTWMLAIKKLFGFVLLGMAVWLIARIVPHAITYLLSGLLLLAVAFFLALSLPRLIGWQRLNRGLGLLMGLIGVVLMINGTMNTVSLAQSTKNVQESAQQATIFTVMQNSQELKHHLALAKEKHRPVILDYFANWCDSCVEMDKLVFQKAEVKEALKNFVLLRVDLSANTAEDESMMDQFQVIAPPTVLFFSPAGQEWTRERIVGEVDATLFLTHLNKIEALNKVEARK